MLLVMIGVLSVLLAFQRPLLPDVVAPFHLSWLVPLCVLFPVVVASQGTRRTLYTLERFPTQPNLAQQIFRINQLLVVWLVGLMHTALLIATPWLETCNDVALGVRVLLPSMIAISPLLLCILLTWVAHFPAERAIRHVAMEAYLHLERRVPRDLTLGAMISYRVRHDILFVLLPTGAIIVARDLVVLYGTPLRELHPLTPDLLLGAGALLVAMFAPEMLRHAWHTTRLPTSPLRDRLVELARRLRVGYREILVWHSNIDLVNAAVVGFVKPLRYILVTDSMLERMSDAKIEAVFGHEAGHVKRHHILYLLLFASISGCMLTLYADWRRDLSETAGNWVGALVATLIVAKWGMLFGWISRTFERQADLYGARSLTVGGLPCHLTCPLHGNDPRPADTPHPVPPHDPTRSDQPVCISATRLFGHTLIDVAALNGMSPESFTWRHGSIQQRVADLDALAANREAAPAFERHVRRMQTGILVVALLMISWTGYQIRIDLLLTRLFGLVAGSS